MSRAGGDPLAADALPALLAQSAMVSEALPDPEPGPVRSALADDGAARIDRAVALMDTAITAYNDRLEAVVEARMRGPKARKGTRFWSDGVKSVSGQGVPDSYRHRTEVKALDASYVLPERMVTEVADAVRPVGLRIVADASAAVAKSLGRPNTGLAALDWASISGAVDSVVQRMLEVNERHAVDIRREILGADSTEGSLTVEIDRVMEATKRGGRWLLLNWRTLATALAGDAALGAAKALGVTHTQWLSRRDDRVRHTHVEADGQVRPVGEKFRVGEFDLRFPADPLVLPAGAREVFGCRCSLIFSRPAPDKARAVGLAQRGTPKAARRLLNLTPRADGPLVASAPELGAPMAIPEVAVPADVVAYRVLDSGVAVTPGQQLSWPGALALALAPPVAAGAAVLAVTVPAGMLVGVSGGALVLAAGVVLAVAAVSAGQIVATPVAAA